MYWNMVLSNWRAEQSAVESIEYSFTHKTRHDERPVTREGKPRPQAIDKTVVYKRYGVAFFEQAEAAVDNDPEKQFKTVVAYDGRVGRSRLREFFPNQLLVGKSAKARERMVPLPWEALTGLSPELLEEQRQNGQLALHSARMEELQGHNCIRIEFVWDPSRSRFIAWYDVERGYWPIRSLDVKASGQRAHEFLIQEIKEVQGEHGNTFFVPVRGMRESVGTHMTVHIDPESIRINHEIPPDAFMLVPRPDELMFDVDLQVLVRDPEKDLDVLSLGDFQPTREYTKTTSSEERGEDPDPETVAVEQTEVTGKSLNRWVTIILIGLLVTVGLVLLLIRHRPQSP